MNTLARPTFLDHLSVVPGEARQSATKYWGQRLTILVLFVCASSFLIGFISSLAVLTIVGFGAAVLGLRRHALGLFGIGILCTLDTTASYYLFSTGGLLRWNTFNYWLLVVVLLSLPFLLTLNDPQNRLWQAFVLLSGVQLVFTPDLLQGAFDFLGIVTAFGIFVYFAANIGDKDIWYWLGVINGTLAGALGFLLYLNLGHISYAVTAWAWTPMTGIFATCLAMYFVGDRWRQQLILVLLTAVNLVWVFLTASRGLMLIAMVCVIFMVLGIRSLSRRIAALTIAVLLGIAVLNLFRDLQPRLVTGSLTHIGDLLNTELPDVTRTSGRSELAVAGWYIFLDHPFGVGTGGFPSAWASLGALEGKLTFRAVGRPIVAHSAYVKVLAENGIVGVLILLSYVCSFAIVGWRTSKQDRRLLALGFLVTVVFITAFFSVEFDERGIWFLATGVTALLHRDNIAQRLRSMSSNDNSPSMSAGLSRHQS